MARAPAMSVACGPSSQMSRGGGGCRQTVGIDFLVFESEPTRGKQRDQLVVLVGYAHFAKGQVLAVVQFARRGKERVTLAGGFQKRNRSPGRDGKGEVAVDRRSKRHVGQGKDGSAVADSRGVELLWLHLHACLGVARTKVNQLYPCEAGKGILVKLFEEGHAI